MDIRKFSALEIGDKIRKKEISSPEVTKAYLDAIEKEGWDINGYVSVDIDEAMSRAYEVQEKIDSGDFISPLAGVPIAVKDNVCIQGGTATSSSKMLANFKPPYTATVVEKINDAGAVIIGKTNMDEFAMGNSNETSFFGATKNPWNHDKIPGGSSGGSAAVVAAELAPYAIGSDSGGSIRQPSTLNNLTGIKPTYGSVSRYGVMAYASSLDQVGMIGRNARDCAASLSIISGSDPKDSTSIMKEPFNFCEQMRSEDTAGDIKGMKIGLPINYYGEGLSEDIRKGILKAADELKSMGAVVEEFELPLIEYAVSAFYLISCAEASSNFARFDGVKYGYRSKNAKDLQDIYYMSRSEGFGTEVKRRIMLGSFVLSSGYFDAYYKKALKVRRLIKNEFDKAFEKYDLILSPVSPEPSYNLNQGEDDPLKAYMMDVYNVSVNLGGLPAIALPCGLAADGMPVGMQFVGDAFSENKLMKAAFAYQDNTDYHLSRPPGIGGGKYERDSKSKFGQGTGSKFHQIEDLGNIVHTDLPSGNKVAGQSTGGEK